MAKKRFVIPIVSCFFLFVLARCLQSGNAVVPNGSPVSTAPVVSCTSSSAALAEIDAAGTGNLRRRLHRLSVPCRRPYKAQPKDVAAGGANTDGSPNAMVRDPVVERMCKRLFNRYGCALVVGVIDARGRHVYAFGKDRHGKQATGDSEFEIASVSKVFTGLLLAQSIMRHEVGLNEPVADVTSFPIPQFDDEPITFKQLATHMSGLPTWPTNRGKTTSPYSTAELESYLQTAQRVGQPGDMTYSNTGYALLGHALAYRANNSYQNLLIERICRPLGMIHTRVWPTKEMQARLAGGHDAQRENMMPSSPTAGGGADGIRSCANDLLKFAGAYSGVIPTDFTDALKFSYAIHEPINDQDDIGLGWYVRKPSGIVWKGGNIAGYHSCVSFQPQKHLGVVVLSSCNAFPAIPLAESILLEMMKQPKTASSCNHAGS